MLIVSIILIITIIVISVWIYSKYIESEETSPICKDCDHCIYRERYRDYELDNGSDRSSSFIDGWYCCELTNEKISKNQKACELIKR